MKILLFGSSGFFGRHIKEAFIKAGHEVYETFGHKRYNLLSLEETRCAFLDSRPDVVVCAAGFNGGLEWNRQYPADIYKNNTTIVNNVVDQAFKFNVRVIFMNAVCAYPDQHKNAMTEDLFLDGIPDGSVEFHAYSKRHSVHIAEAYEKQYGFKIGNLCFTNLFGPGCSYDPEKSKAVEAVIKRVVDAKVNETPEITFWGTGSPEREFMFAPDAAKYVVECLDEKFINIGTEKSISIKNLVELVSKIVDYKGNILWDTTKPDGQPIRVLKIDKFKEKYKLELTPFSEAIAATIKDYIDRYHPKAIAEGKITITKIEKPKKKKEITLSDNDSTVKKTNKESAE